MNPFEILGVNHNSTSKEIDAAYKELAKKYHPDLNPDDPNASQKFKEVQKAYELLNKSKHSSPSFDNFRTRRPPAADFGFDFFSNSIYRGRNIQVQTEIELSEVLTGCDKVIKYHNTIICKECNKGFTDFLNCEQCGGSGQFHISNGAFVISTMCNKCMGRGKIGIKQCEKCNGQGKIETEEKSININIPPGAESGMQIIFSGHGEESLNGGINGDLVVLIIVKDHILFKREDADITASVPISYTQLCLGCELKVPCLTGEVATVKIPENTQINTKFRIKNKGIFHKGKIGDMIISFKLDIPKDINQEYKDVLLKLSEMEQNWPSISQQNWLKNFSSMYSK